MGLTAAEKKALDRLQKKAEEPDSPPVSKSISATVDLSDPKSIAAAVKHGFLTEDQADDLLDDAKDDSNGKKEASTPRRKSYFKDKEDDE